MKDFPKFKTWWFPASLFQRTGDDMAYFYTDYVTNWHVHPLYEDKVHQVTENIYVRHMSCTAC
jgi:hypothetical protein